MALTLAKKFTLTLVFGLFLNACSSTTGSRTQNDGEFTTQTQTSTQKLGIRTEDPYRLVAVDMVGALLQGKKHNDEFPEHVLMRYSNNPLSDAIEEVLIEFGVSIGRVKQKFGKNVLVYTIGTSSDDNSDKEFTITMVMDRIGMKRKYILANDYIEPISSLFVRGVHPDSIKLDDKIFLESPIATTR